MPRPDDIDPHHRWDRPLQAPGRTQVDFEERINFRRLHDYRLARVRAALSGSGLGALLSFDQHNIRYTTSTVIGEWARDKLTRYSLLTGNGDPFIWDFGSAARHHKLHAPWLHEDHCRAGLLGLRGAPAVSEAIVVERVGGLAVSGRWMVWFVEQLPLPALFLKRPGADAIVPYRVFRRPAIDLEQRLALEQSHGSPSPFSSRCLSARSAAPLTPRRRAGSPRSPRR